MCCCLLDPTSTGPSGLCRSPTRALAHRLPGGNGPQTLLPKSPSLCLFGPSPLAGSSPPPHPNLQLFSHHPFAKIPSSFVWILNATFPFLMKGFQACVAPVPLGPQTRRGSRRWGAARSPPQAAAEAGSHRGFKHYIIKKPQKNPKPRPWTPARAPRPLLPRRFYGRGVWLNSGRVPSPVPRPQAGVPTPGATGLP